MRRVLPSSLLMWLMWQRSAEAPPPAPGPCSCINLSEQLIPLKPLRIPGFNSFDKKEEIRRPWTQGGRREDRVVLRVEG